LVAELVDRSFYNLVILTLLPRDQLFPVDRTPKERQIVAAAEKPPFMTIDPELQAAVDRVLKDDLSTCCWTWSFRTASAIDRTDMSLARSSAGRSPTGFSG
jgi:hypothetical protein